jgi:hypothetical protein
MNNVSVVAIFCSDIRQEKGGTETIVGVFPDNVNLPRIPGAFAQMHVYVRLHILPTFYPKSITTRLVSPDGAELSHNEMDSAIVESARGKALANDAPYLGLIARIAIAPMRISQEGRIRAIVAIDGEDHVAGALNCQLAPKRST